MYLTKHEPFHNTSRTHAFTFGMTLPEAILLLRRKTILVRILPLVGCTHTHTIVPLKDSVPVLPSEGHIVPHSCREVVTLAHARREGAIIQGWRECRG